MSQKWAQSKISISITNYEMKLYLKKASQRTEGTNYPLLLPRQPFLGGTAETEKQKFGGGDETVKIIELNSRQQQHLYYVLF